MSRVVLLVDDDPLVLDVAASMLEDIGCEVVTAAGGAEALEKLSGDESELKSSSPILTCLI